MARNTYQFDGGDYLTTMGAVWFVSYCWYDKVDLQHKNWCSISTYNNRLSVYNRTKQYHRFWLQKITEMSENRLGTNSINLSGHEVISMAKKLLDL